jgi:polysaccharide export outer membrane protein
MRRIFTLAVCFSQVISGTTWAQQSQQIPSETAQTTATPTPQPTFVNLSGYSNDYQVGPGDLLTFQIVGHPDLKQTLRISNSGEISHPLIGLVKVADLTAFEVEDQISRRLSEKGQIQQAQVLVEVAEYQAKPVYVSGAVIHPGEFIMSQELTVADAILLAGGLHLSAADEGYVHRRLSAARGESVPASSFAASPEVARPGFEIMKVDLKPMKEGRFDIRAMPLKRGDVLVVPQNPMHQFYVVGEVVTPRDYSYNPKQTLLASQAISWAGGPLITAKMSEGLLVRYDADGKRVDRKVDYSAILEGRQPDFQIQPGDIMFIPGSKMKTIAQGVLQLTSTMVMSASFRVARSYQMPDANDRPVSPGPPPR